MRIPVVGVIGNHDFESGKISEVKSMLEGNGVTILDGECAEFLGIGFAGVPGFGGGFAPQMLNAWGEPIIKEFVQETLDQALRLEKALSRLDTEKRVVLLHYSRLGKQWKANTRRFTLSSAPAVLNRRLTSSK